MLFQTTSKNGGPLFKRGSLARSPRNYKHHYKLATEYSTSNVWDWISDGHGHGMRIGYEWELGWEW